MNVSLVLYERELSLNVSAAGAAAAVFGKLCLRPIGKVPYTTREAKKSSAL